MKASQIGGLIAVFAGLAIVATQIVREVPWQLGIAAGFFIALMGAIALVDDEPPKPPTDGGAIVPFERSAGR